jgi:hypothetical protein
MDDYEDLFIDRNNSKFVEKKNFNQKTLIDNSIYMNKIIHVLF